MKKIRSLFKFSPFSIKQKKILTWWMPSSPVKDKNGIIADGAIRSGKTVSMALSFVMWAMECFDACNFAMCGKTIGSFKRNVWFWLKLMLLSRGYRIKKYSEMGDNVYIISRKGKSNYFYIFGGRDERSQDLIQGITLAGVFFDEVALMPESFVNQATGRCSVSGSKFWFNCNPGSPTHWFKVNWINKAKEKKLIHLHFTMDDNLSLSEDVKERYRSMYVGVFFKRFILGLWVMAEGAIYDVFGQGDKDGKSCIVDELPALINPHTRYITIDYGTTNPCVFLEAIRYEGTSYIAREYVWDSKVQMRQKTDDEYVKDLKEFMGDNRYNGIILDPSAASFAVALRRAGIRVLDADNEVLDGIRIVSSLLHIGKLKVHKSCKRTIDEFYSYTWDDKAAERGEEKPIKMFDHCMDAIRYFCKTIIRVVRVST